MAVIVFYDTSELDKQQLSDALSVTDHYWEYVDDSISLESINADAEIVSVFISSTVTREMIERMPRLTLICCRSTGYNNVDLEAAKEHNVTVVNVPTYGEETVAEYAFTMLLALTRRLEAVIDSENEEFHPPELCGRDLSGKTFGVIGTGHIGQKSLKIASGFSMRTLAYDLYPKEGLDKALGFEYVGLEQLLAESDFVSLHVPYTKDTHHTINKDRIAGMKEGAILINTARGALVDTGALVEALNSGHLGGAALDVIEGERLLDIEEEVTLLQAGERSVDTLRHSVEISVLKKMPNVIISPHNAFNTIEAVGRINSTTAQNIIDFYNNHIPNAISLADQTTGKLILLRHTESEWNACGVWSGVTDICLSEKGEQDCVPVAKSLKELGINIDVACHTDQKRTSQTLEGVCNVLGDGGLQKICEPGFNERNYGEYTGMDKWKVKEQLGEEQFNKIRRGWDVPFPNGETLKDVYNRVVPAYKNTILPLLRQGKNVLIVAHGNSLRALRKYIESIPDGEVENLEMLMNQMIVFEIDPVTGLKRSAEVKDTGVAIESKF